ncbi:hypothetical protein CGCTS75_v005203 [Colletotrichum tropicale]|nr:hypothetical protein CGCTS75_v005203 [Colletotrichum tropicale]
MSVATHSDHKTCFVPELDRLCIESRFPDSHEDVYQGDLAFLESPGPAIDPNEGRFVHLRCYRQNPSTLRRASHCDSLIIAAGSACLANGPSKSAVGVYFGPNNPFNLCLRVPTEYRIGKGIEKLLLCHTTHRAELYAVIAALSAIILFTDQAPEHAANGNIPNTLKHVIIKTESWYIVDKICRMGVQRPLVFHKACDAGKSDRGCLEHCNLWEKLRQELHRFTLRGAVVQFWFVPRDQNLEARALANMGMENPPWPSVEDSQISSSWVSRVKIDSALKLGEYGCSTGWQAY